MKYINAIRYHEWWENKLCPLLAIGYATILMGDVPFLQASVYFLFILTSVAVGAAYVCLINDLTDMKEDLQCGKPNRMAGLSPKARWIFPVACLLAGSIFFFYLMGHDLLSFILYPIPCIAFTLYSFEPFRLKRKGIWGALADASGSHIFTSLYVVAVMSYFTGQQINWIWFLAVGVWALCYGIRGILWHQFRDRDNDMQIGLKTFVTTQNPVTFYKKSRLIFSIEILALTVMLIEIGQLLCFLFLTLYGIIVWMRYSKKAQHIVLVQTPPSGNFQLLMMDYYQVLLPVSLLFIAIDQQATIILILILHLTLFPRRPWYLAKDTVHFLRYTFIVKTT